MHYLVGDIEPTDAKRLLDAAGTLTSEPNGQPLGNEHFVAVRKRDFERLKEWVEGVRHLTEEDGATSWHVAYPELFPAADSARPQLNKAHRS